MKTKTLSTPLVIAGMAVLLSMTLQSTGPHGGIVKKAESYNIEVKTTDTSFYAYLLDAKLKTISNKGVSGEVRLFFSDSTTLNVQLQPSAGDGFTAKTLAGFYACKITFQAFGKPVSAQFENQTSVVQQK